MNIFWSVATYLEGDGLLQNIKQELQLQQGRSLSRVGGQGQEAMLLAPREQVLLKQPGELLQAGRRQGQRAAAIQHQVACGLRDTILPLTFKGFQAQLLRPKPNVARCTSGGQVCECARGNEIMWGTKKKKKVIHEK